MFETILDNGKKRCDDTDGGQEVGPDLAPTAVRSASLRITARRVPLESAMVARNASMLAKSTTYVNTASIGDGGGGPIAPAPLLILRI